MAMEEERLSGAAIRIVAAIVIVIALLAIYANVQRHRTGSIESVTVSPTPAPNE